jgi:hypothetical protein
MNTILFTFAFFLFIFAIMAIGYIVAGKSIKGSCGGLNAIEGLNGACDICAGRSKCSKRQRMLAEQAKQAQK